MRNKHVGGVIVSLALRQHWAEIVALARKSRLPTISGPREFAQVGGLMAYGPHYSDLFRRAATYVDKILKGVKPADLPVEQPTTFEFAINLKTAKALGLTIPRDGQGRAKAPRSSPPGASGQASASGLGLQGRHQPAPDIVSETEERYGPSSQMSPYRPR